MALLSDLEIRWDDLMTASAVQVCWNGQAGAISDCSYKYSHTEVSLPHLDAVAQSNSKLS